MLTLYRHPITVQTKPLIQSPLFFNKLLLYACMHACMHEMLNEWLEKKNNGQFLAGELGQIKGWVVYRDSFLGELPLVPGITVHLHMVYKTALTLNIVWLIW